MFYDIQSEIAAVRYKKPSVSNSLHSLTLNKTDAKGKKAQFNAELKVACDGFEEIFTKKMLQTMRSNIKKTDFINGGHGEEIFQDMLDENYSKLITQTKALGLSDWIYESAKKN